MDKTIKPAERLHGQIDLPGDKSISHRVVFIGGISGGITRAGNFLKAEDSFRTITAFRDMGIDIEIKDKDITIRGGGLKGLRKPDKELYLGNSGTTMRILPGILAGQAFEVMLTGDKSLSKRPMERIMEPLKMMGADIYSKKRNGFPPIVIRGGGELAPIKYSTKVASAQVKSCILFAGLYAAGLTSVTEPFTSRDHTERMLGFSGAKISKKHLTVSVEGGAELDGRKFFIPGDISSAAFFIAGASMLEGSDVTVRNIGLNPTRTGFLNTLIKMGGDVNIQNTKDATLPYGDVRVKYAKLKSVVIEEKDIPLIIDEVPILSVLASRAEGRSVIKGIRELRVKETDRIFSMTENLKRMGVDIRIENDNLVVNGGKKRFEKAALESFQDHRTAMSMAIAGLSADGNCEIKDVDCIDTSFPDFFHILDYLKK